MAEDSQDRRRLLGVHGLEVTFATDTGPFQAVRDVSFDIDAGRTLAVVGESGSGKSVTAQAVMGILPRNGAITGGLVHLHGPDGRVTSLSDGPPDSAALRAIRGRRIAMIFQEPMSSFSPLHTIGDQVTEALRTHARVTRKAAGEAAMALFEKVGFHDPRAMLRTYPFELSGGMRQRAMIAMALICEPDLLVADEPTTALDVTTQAQILELIQDLQAQMGMAVLLITHDLGIVAGMADEVVVMYRGAVMERGSREQIFGDARHPYLKGLMRALPRFHMRRDERLVPLRAVKVADADFLCRTAAKPVPAGLPVLSVEGVSKSFLPRSAAWAHKARKATALDEVSFSVLSGQTLGLVGESGSGKTTLARIIMASLAADEGRVRFDGGDGLRDLRDFDGDAMKAYRRAVQFVFQDPFSSLNPRMTVRDILEEPLVIHEVGDGGERYGRVKMLLDLVGLPRTSLQRYPHSFSGGQRQRICLARALALSPSLVICDEPTSALDVSVQAQVLNLLKDLQAQLGLSYLFVSHNLAVVDYMADDIVVLCRGLVVERAPRDILFRAPRHPYTKALIAAVPTPDLEAAAKGACWVRSVKTVPQSWPAPYRIVPGVDHGAAVEVDPGHFVRMGRAADAA